MLVVHPYAPDIQWRIAVSRRFHDREAEAFYFDVVFPVLSEEGMVLECSYAADEPSYPDYWTNRMKVILELSDIHVLLDVNPSANTGFEFQMSRSYAQRAGANAVRLSFNWEPHLDKSLVAPVSLTITKGHGDDTFSENTRLGVVHIDDDGVEGFQRRLRTELARAEECRTKALRRTLPHDADGPSRRAPGSSEATRELRKMMALCRLLEGKQNIDQIRAALPKDLQSSISPLADVLFPKKLRTGVAPLRELGLIGANEIDQWTVRVREGTVTVRGRLWPCFRESKTAAIERFEQLLHAEKKTGWFGRTILGTFVLLAVIGGWFLQRDAENSRTPR
jgi:hypothetical protein